MNQSFPQKTPVIPYVPILRPLAGSTIATILWTQLDYWFRYKAEGFYKFMGIPQSYHPKYRNGDSWTEELQVSVKVPQCF